MAVHWFSTGVQTYMYFESVKISGNERRYAVFNARGQMMFYTTSVLAARMFIAGKSTNMWSGG